MSLEDHLGDILRKARAMSGLSAAAAARAAGITDEDLAALEGSGMVRGHPNLTALAAALGLDGAKLHKIAAGWLPAHQDLSHWRELRRITTDNGMAVNCYMAWDPSTREAAVFDTGWSATPILELLSTHKLNLRYIFITHTHNDHIACLDDVQRRCPSAQVYSGGSPAPGDPWQLGPLRISNRNTPGHSSDGVTFIADNWPGGAPAVAIVGDAIFAGSMGRGNVSWSLARQKVREEILTLPANTLICPGHGPLTTVAEEKAHNPFF